MPWGKNTMPMGVWAGVRRGVSLVTCAVALLFGQVPIGTPAQAGENWPAEVRASYKVVFNGFEIGDFRFQTSITPQGYAADAHAKLSALMGAFKWKGSTRSSGKVDAHAPKPIGYAFDFKSNKKHGSVAMSFKGATVADVSVEPPRKPHKQKRLVPIEPEHLREVLDPLSAVLALTHDAGDNPCEKKLAIFDGQRRFDLIFSYRRQQRITESRPSGQPGIGYVCSVRYVPIAGHKRDNDDDEDDDNDNSNVGTSGDVEITLRPVPSANLLVPHQVNIPMMVGSVEIRSERIEITTPNKGQIALTN